MGFTSEIEKGKPSEMDLPLMKKRYHNNFKISKNMSYTADIKGFRLMISNRNRSVLELLKLKEKVRNQ